MGWQALISGPAWGNSTKASKKGKIPTKRGQGVQETIVFETKDNWITLEISVKTKNVSAEVFASSFSPYSEEGGLASARLGLH